MDGLDEGLDEGLTDGVRDNGEVSEGLPMLTPDFGIFCEGDN